MHVYISTYACIYIYIYIHIHAYRSYSIHIPIMAHIFSSYLKLGKRNLGTQVLASHSFVGCYSKNASRVERLSFREPFGFLVKIVEIVSDSFFQPTNSKIGCLEEDKT